MDETVFKQAVTVLVEVVREQHLQIQRAYGLLTTFRAAFPPEIAQKIDVLVKDGAIQDSTSVPYRDGTTARLDEVLRLIQHS